MAKKTGRKTQAQKKSEETKFQRRKNLEKAVEYLIKHFNIKQPEIEKRGDLSDRWYEIFETTRSKSKLSICLYHPGSDTRAIKLIVYHDNKTQSLDMDLWSTQQWGDLIEDSKKYYAFIKRNK